MTSNPASKRRLFVYFTFILVLLLIGLMLPFFQRPTLTGIPAKFDRIQKGMSEKEVEDILGGPRGIHDKTRWYSNSTAIGGHWSGCHTSTWYFPDCALEVVFHDGKVAYKHIEPPLPISPFERAIRQCKQTWRLLAS